MAKPKPAPSKKPPSKPAKGKPGARAAQKKTPAPSPPFALPQISPERRLDILGGALALAGLLTLVALFSTTRSSLTGGWLDLLALIFGWGSYVLPIALIVFGGWLVLRKVERLPSFSAGRAIGLILFYLWSLVILQWAAGNPPQGSVTGGGYVGSLLYRLLDMALGRAGALVALLAWLIIALSLSLDMPVQGLFGWLAPLGRAISGLINRFRRTEGGAAPGTAPGMDNGFTPLDRSSIPTPPVSPPFSANMGGTGGETPRQLGGPGTPIAWQLPTVQGILDLGSAPSVNEEFFVNRAHLIEETLASFGAPVQVVQMNRGPAVTQFGVEPLFIETRAGRTRVRVGKIVSLADDLSLALAAPRIRIQAPVPGRSYVGIEVPNDEMQLVTLREILEGEGYQRNRKTLSVALGRDVSGHPTAADISALPHLLIAGTTGSGKSVCVNSILTALLLYNTPDEMRLILVDPKRVELTNYNGIPHLLSPVVVEMERVIGALQWMTREMDKRYHEFAQIGARNIQDYNTRMKSQGGRKLPYLVIVIDELADLMMLAPDETERTITRLAQLARATGIHLILATQRPSVDVVTGIIKANFPARIAFAVASNTDSRVILDQPGAERLLGRGDMLYQAPDSPSPVRLQGVFVSDTEIHRLVDFWRDQAGSTSAYAVGAGSAPVDAAPSGVPLKQVPMFEDMMPLEAQGDPLLGDAIDLVRREGRASVSMLQRRMRIGYTRAARLVDTMEARGIVGPPQDMTGVRPVLDYGPTAPPKET
jgi:S-DNA-T family DNA segregation ATPase FtsK/SpoIIIE